jgi:hypothetical protein
MGLDAHCTARWKGRTSEGQARLEEKEVLFRGEFRLSIPLKDIASAEARRGTLTVKFSGGTAAFDLGAAAEKWALKIRYPRSRAEKLGVKPGLTACVLGIADEHFLRELTAGVGADRDLPRGGGGEPQQAASGAGRIATKPVKDADLIFFAAEDRAALAQLKRLQGSMKKTGALWVVYPKGQKHITQLDVMAAAKSAGLVDVKVVSFSETHTALKLMIPLARR